MLEIDMARAAPKKPKRLTAHESKTGIFLRLPPDLLAEIDAISEREYRPRARTIELACRQFVEERNRSRKPA
jgi:metal-responsive CopG/Arc/MetJ family transcriptional regulator